jgi:hypothetical protein
VQRVIGASVVVRTHGAQGLEVRRNRAARRKVAAGRGDRGAAGACEQRPQEQHRPAKAPDQRAIWRSAFGSKAS